MASLNIIQWKCQAWPLQKIEKSNLSKRKGLEVQLRKIYAEFEKKLLTIWSFSTIDNLLDGLSIPSKFLKNPQDASILWISSAFLWRFIHLFVLLMSHVPCPMSHVGFFLKMCWPYLYPLVHVVAWACLELTGWNIKIPWLVFVVVVVVFFIFAPLALLVLDMLLGGQGRVGRAGGGVGF